MNTTSLKINYIERVQLYLLSTTQILNKDINYCVSLKFRTILVHRDFEGTISIKTTQRDSLKKFEKKMLKVF